MSEVEALSAKFHEIYMQEAKRQGDVRHKDAYADLPENVKEFDRVLARYVLTEIQDQVAAALREAREAMKGVESIVEFYLKREIESPANHQEFAREADEKLQRFRAAILALIPDPSAHQHTDSCYSPVPETEGKGRYLNCGLTAGALDRRKP